MMPLHWWYQQYSFNLHPINHCVLVYCHVLAAFRYGREDLDVLGLTFRKDLFLVSIILDLRYTDTLL